MGEIIHTKDSTLIIDGGNNLPGAPDNWEWAHEWEKKVNGNTKEWEGPLWRFDCGFKLDYDGPILSINSRFYPPADYYGPTWDGSVTVRIGEKEIEDKQFDCKTLEELRAQVERYVNKLKERITLKPE